jgi:hypothetical protein
MLTLMCGAGAWTASWQILEDEIFKGFEHGSKRKMLRRETAIKMATTDWERFHKKKAR